MGEKDKYGYRHDDGHYSKTTGNGDKVAYSIYDRNPSEPGHSSIHINYDTSTGEGNIVEKDSDGNKETTDIKCFLTTACMRKFKKNFDDNCHELTKLRWLRDNIISKKDVIHYYEIAPTIVELIDRTSNSNKIYEYIYNNIITPSVNAVDAGKYEEAYSKYKNGVTSLEEVFIEKDAEKVLRKLNPKTL